MERPLNEVVASQAAMLQRLGRAGAAMSERQLAATYRQQVEQVKQLLTAYPDRIAVLSVNYHAALAEPGTTAARVNAFLGGGLDETAMAAAVEPSLRRQQIA
jgi:hypothetical protein